MDKVAPTQFKASLYADVGAGEPFVARITGLLDILGATLCADRDAIKEAVMAMLFDCLVPAFMSLRDLRKVANDPAAPVISKVKAFDDMCKSLWTAYKDRMQTAASLIGYDIGFLFEDDSKFQKGCIKFATRYPEVDGTLIQRMKDNRATWQPDLERFRNCYLEHKKIPLQEMAPFYSLQRGEELFAGVWVAAEEILAILLAAKLPEAACLREIPEAERDPGNPTRFGFALRSGVKLGPQ
jgi:hypothetical protein